MTVEQASGVDLLSSRVVSRVARRRFPVGPAVAVRVSWLAAGSVALLLVMAGAWSLLCSGRGGGLRTVARQRGLASLQLAAHGPVSAALGGGEAGYRVASCARPIRQKERSGVTPPFAESKSAPAPPRAGEFEDLGAPFADRLRFCFHEHRDVT
jgi:hypothetical protein